MGRLYFYLFIYYSLTEGLYNFIGKYIMKIKTPH